MSMFKVNSFCHLHSFFARCFYPIVEFFVLGKQKRYKLPTTTTAKNYETNSQVFYYLRLPQAIFAKIIHLRARDGNKNAANKS